MRLQLQARTRELALFNLGIDSKLRGCDLLKLRVRDISNGERVSARATVMQLKTARPVQFEITDVAASRQTPGSSRRTFGRKTFCSQAEPTNHRILEPGSTHEL